MKIIVNNCNFHSIFYGQIPPICKVCLTIRQFLVFLCIVSYKKVFFMTNSTKPTKLQSFGEYLSYIMFLGLVLLPTINSWFQADLDLCRKNKEYEQVAINKSIQLQKNSKTKKPIPKASKVVCFTKTTPMIEFRKLLRSTKLPV
jgi:uncharacterized membrane protein